MKQLLSISIACMALFSCATPSKEKAIAIWKQEILAAEQQFAELAQKEGTYPAFLAFASPDAVLLRGEVLIEGRAAIDAFYKDRNSTSLDWRPDFVEVSESGDLGYTYGQYTYSYRDTDGNAAESKGIFHTVWKRQPDGSWKFVWD